MWLLVLLLCKLLWSMGFFPHGYGHIMLLFIVSYDFLCILLFLIEIFHSICFSVY